MFFQTSSAASDVQIFLTQVLQYYKMPESLGGLGGDIDNADADDFVSYIGWGDEHPMTNDNASYMIQIPKHSDDMEIVDIKAIGRAELNGKHSVVHGRITFPEGKIVSKVGEIEKTGDIVEVDDFGFDLWDGKD